MRSKDDSRRDSSDLIRFMLGVGSWFGSFGLHGVLFSTLLVVELRETELRVGVAQSAMMVPAVVLMLLGGIVADHADRRRLLVRLHFAAAGLAVLLGVALLTGWLSYSLLLLYAVGMGALQAFVNPARDALLSDVAGEDVGRPVTLMNLTQWGSQAAGALAAGQSLRLGAGLFFFLQAAVLMTGAVGYGGMTRFARSPRPAPTLGQLTDGIREVARTPDLLATWILVCGVGVLFIGPFMVVFPLMVRDVYLRGAPEIALVSAAFPLGTITGSLAVMQRGGIRDLMTSQYFALSTAALTLIAVSFDMPFWGVLLGVYAWGLSGAVFMIAGRTLFQLRASAANRGRVLAAYTMGFMGAAGLVGAPLSATLSLAFGPQGALVALGSTMLALVATVVLWSRFRS
ncbi:MAG: MFS transporter [Deltaproteobacteria bacterium]|nr:MFS transporter [Deltaproteobacteria bacterium]